MVHVARLASRAGAAPRGLCDAVQAHVCRLAVDAPLPVAATAVARHVRECEACSDFADELGRVRRWLRVVPLPGELAREPGGIGPMARVALSRELLARLARDLLQRARGKAGRAREDTLRDQRRIEALAQEHPGVPLTSEADMARAKLASSEGPLEPTAALEAAAHLDPVGLDIALAWLGSLERAGRGVQAQRLTDSMLARLP